MIDYCLSVGYNELLLSIDGKRVYVYEGATMTFEGRITAQLEDKAFRNSATGKRLKKVLAMPTKRKERILARMERHALAHLGKDSVADWSKVGALDWKTIIQLLIKLLPLLLLFL